MEDSKEVKGESMQKPTYHITDNKEHLMKFREYEDEMKQYLISKYFSDNTVLGDVKYGQPSAAKRLPLYQSLQDHNTFLELIREEPSASSETTTSGDSEGEPSIIMDTNEHIEKLKKYEAEVKEYLNKKYLSDNTIFGGVKDGQHSATNRLPLYQSLQDHKTFLELIREKPSASGETTTSVDSKGKPSA